MSELITQVLARAKSKFIAANKYELVSWEQEAQFAKQALRSNPILAECLPDTIVDAVINVASTGLTLNPAQKLAHLVPRKGVCCLDISYMGLIKLAVDAGSIRYAKADLVYSLDTFTYRGPTEKPVHECDPFALADKRGTLVGAYCIAELVGGGYLVEVMPKYDIDTARSKSKARSGPWFDFFTEMVKKTVIKRASKTWPKTERSIFLDRAIKVLNDHEGFADTNHSTQASSVLISDEQLHQIESLVDEYQLPTDKVLRMLKVPDLGHIPADGFDQAKKTLISLKPKGDAAA